MYKKPFFTSFGVNTNIISHKIEVYRFSEIQHLENIQDSLFINSILPYMVVDLFSNQKNTDTELLNV
jgi:hypothetical protein